MKRVKVISLISLGVLFLVVSFCIGGYLGYVKGLKHGGLTRSLAEMVKIQDHLSTQFQHADCEGVKKSLNEYLIFLDKQQNVESLFFTESTRFADKMMAHVRLALIERRLGNEIEAKRHLELAESFCNAIGREECSEERMISFINKVDKKKPIKCLEESQN